MVLGVEVKLEHVAGLGDDVIGLEDERRAAVNADRLGAGHGGHGGGGEDLDELHGDGLIEPIG